MTASHCQIERTSFARRMLADVARTLELGRLFDECAFLTLLVATMVGCAFGAM